MSSDTERITPEILHSFVYFEEEEQLHRLLHDNPGLANYVVPLLALFQAVEMLAILVYDGQWDIEDTGVTLEFVSLPDGGIEARPAHRGPGNVEELVPLLIRAAQSGVNFLNERGYRLLVTLAQGTPDAEMRDKLRRYRDALRLCLDQGYDDEWLAQRDAQLRAEDDPQQGAQERDWLAYGRLREFFAVKDAAQLAQLARQEPWMHVYSEGLPIEFTDHQFVMRQAAAQFCWPASWAQQYRTVKNNSCLLTPAAWQFLERVTELALTHLSEDSVHGLIATRMRVDRDILQRCAEEGIEHVFLDIAHRYVVGTL